MPTYEYACPACGERYEKREGFDAPAKQKCQVCRKGMAQRVLHAPPVVFKGSGFYKTDSRGSSESSSSPASASAPVSDDASKPAADDAKSKPEPASTSAESSSTEAAAAG